MLNDLRQSQWAPFMLLLVHMFLLYSSLNRVLFYECNCAVIFFVLVVSILEDGES